METGYIKIINEESKNISVFCPSLLAGTSQKKDKPQQYKIVWIASPTYN
jgi:hypothetical protein